MMNKARALNEMHGLFLCFHDIGLFKAHGRMERDYLTVYVSYVNRIVVDYRYPAHSCSRKRFAYIASDTAYAEDDDRLVM